MICWIVGGGLIPDLNRMPRLRLTLKLCLGFLVLGLDREYLRDAPRFIVGV